MIGWVVFHERGQDKGQIMMLYLTSCNNKEHGAVFKRSVGIMDAATNTPEHVCEAPKPLDLSSPH